MQVVQLVVTLLSWSLYAAATILQNGQVRENPYPGQVPRVELDDSWRHYPADAPEISYKGRWDSRHVSWWSAAGFKVDFTGNELAVSFGPYTNDGVLVAYRIGSLDWQFSNVTAESTFQFVNPETEIDTEAEKNVFELRAQIAGVSVPSNATISKTEPFKRKVEIIGGSIASGQYGTYETLSSWSWLFANGLGNAEFGITAYPGVCLADLHCYGGGVHGMTWFWHRASDPGSRAGQIFGGEPEEWDVSAEQPADLVVIQMGGNDHRKPNEVPSKDYYHAYIDMVEDVHRVWPHATVLLMLQWDVWHKQGTKWVPSNVYENETKAVHEHFKDRGFVYYFDTEGLLQHNDINPKNHPTDVGHIKIASHLLQWTKLVLQWKLEPTGEVGSGMEYWNNQQEY